MAEEYISLKPSDAVKGGGVIAEGRYKITSAKFILFDYGGTVVPAQPSLAIDFTNADGATSVQCYSAGDAKNLVPSEDHKRLKKVGSTTGLNDGSNCFLFMQNLVNAGFSEDKLGGDISVIEGLEVDVIHVATKDRDIGGKKVAGKALPVVAKIVSAPSDTAKAKGASKATAAKANGQQDPAVLVPKATEALISALKSVDSHSLDKKALTAAMYKIVPATDPDRVGVLQLVIKEDFLAGLIDSAVLYDPGAGTVTYVGA